MQTELNKTDDGTIELTITIPWDTVKKSYDKIADEEVKQVEVQGFRKGKAPRELAEKKLNNEKIWQQVLEKVIPQYYSQALQKEQIKPILAPQIQLLKAARGNDLTFKATTAETPKVELGDYKKALEDLTAKKAPYQSPSGSGTGQAAKIWVPEGAGKIKSPKGAKKDSEEKEKKEKVTLNDVLEKLLKIVKITLPTALVERQTNQQLTQLLDQVKQVGMTIQQYAQSKGKTVEQMRKEIEEEAAKTLKLEFILEKIADAEKISVDDKEIEDFISKSKDKKEQATLRNQRYFIASLLRRQKTLQRLLE